MDALAPLARRVRSLPPRALALAAAAAIGLAIALALAFSATRDDRVALFATPLRPDQLADVETRLAAWRVPYAPLADNVRVAPRGRAEILLRLSLAGLPRRHLAGPDETFAKLGALTPQAILEAQTREALAAELAESLRGLDGIADARVIVAPAAAGLYADEAGHAASASVRVSLAAGARLAPPTVAAIRAFVAGGVPGLSTERVTVLDDRGALAGAASADDDVQRSLQDALDAAFGSGATIVRVHREPLGEARESHDVRRSVLPGALTRTTGDERFAGEKKRYAKQNSTEERASETHDVRRTQLPDATKHRSVAIFVDGARAIDLDAIRKLAAAAAGLDTRRGDTLSVEAVRFAGPVLARRAELDRWGVAALLAGIAPQFALALGLAGVAAAAARPALALAGRIVDGASARAAARESVGLPPVRVRGALAGEPPHVAAAVISALPAATAAAVLELYPPEERAQIVRRLARAPVDLVPPAEELLRARF